MSGPSRQMLQLRAERDAAEERFRAAIARNVELASALEDVTLCLEEDHGDTVGDAGCCFHGECEWARSIRVARALLDVNPRALTPEPR
jgi:hypothetical protein